jgi:hypothetical protein
MTQIYYKKFIEEFMQVQDRNSCEQISFKLNKLQSEYTKLLNEKIFSRDIILKLRQVGLSRLILAVITANFILKPYNKSIVVCHSRDSQEEAKKIVRSFLLDYVRRFIKIYGFRKNAQLLLFKEDNKTIENLVLGSKIIFSNSNEEWHHIGCGENMHDVFLDEFAFFNQKDIFEKTVSLCQTVPREHGNIFITSTNNNDGQNLFEDLFNRKNNDLSDFRRLCFTKREILLGKQSVND